MVPLPTLVSIACQDRSGFERRLLSPVLATVVVEMLMGLNRASGVQNVCACDL